MEITFIHFKSGASSHLLSFHKSYHDKWVKQRDEVDELRKKSQSKKSLTKKSHISDGLKQPKLFGGVGKSLQV